MSNSSRETARAPLVSVIVPVYNGADVIGDCIESLLDQDYPKDRCEVIVVDNGSTDNTSELVKRYPVTYVLEGQEHTSYAARNAGVRHAKGEVYAFCDADQSAVRDWLRVLLRRFDDSEYGAFAGEVVAAKHDDSFLARYAAAEESGCLEAWRTHPGGPTAGSGNVAIRKEVFHKLGGFDTASPSGADLMMGWGVTQRLGMKIAYEKDALMRHKLRASEADLLRRETRLAYGKAFLNERLGLPGSSPASLLLKSLSRIARSAGVLAFRTLWPFHKDSAYKRYAAQMHIRMTIAHLRGSVAYRLSRGRNRGIR